MKYEKLTDEEKNQRKEQRKKNQYNKTHKIIDGVDYKFCNKHKKYFPEENEWFPSTIEFFHENKSNSIDGLHPECKRCGSAKFLDKYYNDGGITKQKTINAATIRYHTVESDRQIKLKNGQRQREEGYQAEWRKNNPDRAKYHSNKHRNHDMSKTEWKACLNTFDYSCAYCGISEEEALSKQGQRLHKEHVDHDGYNDLRNCVPACRSCNDHKWQFAMDDWYQQQEFFNENNYNKIIWWITEGYLNYIEEKPNYKIKLKRKKNNDDTYSKYYELWSLDEKRNLSECIDTNINKHNFNLDLI